MGARAGATRVGDRPRPGRGTLRPRREDPAREQKAWATDKGGAQRRCAYTAGRRLRRVRAAQGVEGGDELAAALRLLEAESLAGKVVSADAGLLQAPLVQKVVRKGGPISV